MRPLLSYQKYSSEEDINGDEFDLLLEVNIDENASALSRRSSNECHVSSNMDPDDSWEVTIVPTSQATSSSDTSGPFVRVLNTVTEHGTKRDLCFLTNGHKKENEETYQDAARPKLMASSTYERLNRFDNSRRPSNSDNRSTSVLRRDENELDGQTDGKLSNICSGICEDTSNESKSLFIELGAIYKVLDFITDSDPEVSSLTSNCCSEISRILRYLIALRRDKKLDDLLLNDFSLYRCERCGVISRMLESYPAIEEIEGNETRAVRGTDVTTTERDCLNGGRNKEEFQISTNRLNLKNNAQVRVLVDNTEMDRRAKYKNGLNETESLPVRERSFVIKRCTGRPNGAINISNTETNANARIKNTPQLNNSTIKRLFANYEVAKRNTRYELNSATRKNRSCRDKPLITTKVRTDIDTEKVLRKISYENTSQIDNLPVADWSSKSTRKSQGLRRLFKKDDEIISVADTVKYLARGQFTALDKKEDDVLSKLQDRRCVRLEDPSKKQCSVLYGSRDDYPRCESGFWLFDESGHSPEIASDEYRYLPMPRMNDNSDGFRACNMEKNSKKKTDSWTECMEKDSLENCALLERREESDTTTCSSFSAENLIHEWIGSLDEKNDTNDTNRDIPLGRRLVSSRPSLDIARHVRAEIAEARRSGNARESMGEPRARDSDVLVRSSPEARNKICHPIGKMILSNIAEDPVRPSCREENLATYIDALNDEKLVCSESSNATFVHSDKTFKVSNGMINIWLDDCIPTKLSKLPGDKSRLIERQSNVAETRSQSESKDRVRTSQEYSTADKLGKTELADESSGKITRRIIYKNVSPGNVDNDDEIEILPVYREILDNSEGMDWDSFRELIENLHPGQRKLWRDICEAVNEEAERMAGDTNDSTEVCIEISPVILGGDLKTDQPTACAREIAFELDMTLKDVESFLDKRPHLAEERLDTHRDADEGVPDWSDGGRKPNFPKRAR